MLNQVVYCMLKRAWLQLIQVVDGDHGVLTVVVGLEPGHAGGSPWPFSHPTGRGPGFSTASTKSMSRAALAASAHAVVRHLSLAAHRFWRHANLRVHADTCISILYHLYQFHVLESDFGIIKIRIEALLGILDQIT